MPAHANHMHANHMHALAKSAIYSGLRQRAYPASDQLQRRIVIPFQLEILINHHPMYTVVTQVIVNLDSNSGECGV